MTKTGKSRKSISLAEDIIIQYAFFEALSEVPGINLLQFGTMFIDAIDPYNYNNTLTRSAMDQHAKNAYDLARKLENDPSIRVKLRSGIKKRTTNLTEKDIEELIDKQTAHWAVFNPTPMNFTDCFRDFTHPDGTEKSASGPPNPTCDIVYKTAYETYVKENKVKYETDEINTSNHFIEIINNLSRLSVRVELQKKRDYYVKIISNIGVALALVVVVSVFVYIYMYSDK